MDTALDELIVEYEKKYEGFINMNSKIVRLNQVGRNVYFERYDGDVDKQIFDLFFLVDVLCKGMNKIEASKVNLTLDEPICKAFFYICSLMSKDGDFKQYLDILNIINEVSNIETLRDDINMLYCKISSYKLDDKDEIEKIHLIFKNLESCVINTFKSDSNIIESYENDTFHVIKLNTVLKNYSLKHRSIKIKNMSEFLKKLCELDFSGYIKIPRQTLPKNLHIEYKEKELTLTYKKGQDKKEYFKGVLPSYDGDINNTPFLDIKKCEESIEDWLGSKLNVDNEIMITGSYLVDKNLRINFELDIITVSIEIGPGARDTDNFNVFNTVVKNLSSMMNRKHILYCFDRWVSDQNSLDELDKMLRKLGDRPIIKPPKQIDFDSMVRLGAICMIEDKIFNIKNKVKIDNQPEILKRQVQQEQMLIVKFLSAIKQGLYEVPRMSYNILENYIEYRVHDMFMGVALMYGIVAFTGSERSDFVDIHTNTPKIFINENGVDRINEAFTPPSMAALSGSYFAMTYATGVRHESFAGSRAGVVLVETIASYFIAQMMNFVFRSKIHLLLEERDNMKTFREIAHALVNRRYSPAGEIIHTLNKELSFIGYGGASTIFGWMYQIYGKELMNELMLYGPSGLFARMVEKNNELIKQNDKQNTVSDVCHNYVYIKLTGKDLYIKMPINMTNLISDISFVKLIPKNLNKSTGKKDDHTDEIVKTRKSFTCIEQPLNLSNEYQLLSSMSSVQKNETDEYFIQCLQYELKYLNEKIKLDVPEYNITQPTKPKWSNNLPAYIVYLYEMEEYLKVGIRTLSQFVFNPTINEPFAKIGLSAKYHDSRENILGYRPFLFNVDGQYRNIYKRFEVDMEKFMIYARMSIRYIDISPLIYMMQSFLIKNLDNNIFNPEKQYGYLGTPIIKTGGDMVNSLLLSSVAESMYNLIPGVQSVNSLYKNSNSLMPPAGFENLLGSLSKGVKMYLSEFNNTDDIFGNSYIQSYLEYIKKDAMIVDMKQIVDLLNDVITYNQTAINIVADMIGKSPSIITTAMQLIEQMNISGSQKTGLVSCMVLPQFCDYIKKASPLHASMRYHWIDIAKNTQYGQNTNITGTSAEIYDSITRDLNFALATGYSSASSGVAYSLLLESINIIENVLPLTPDDYDFSLTSKMINFASEKGIDSEMAFDYLHLTIYELLFVMSMVNLVSWVFYPDMKKMESKLYRYIIRGFTSVLFLAWAFLFILHVKMFDREFLLNLLTKLDSKSKRHSYIVKLGIGYISTVLIFIGLISYMAKGIEINREDEEDDKDIKESVEVEKVLNVEKGDVKRTLPLNQTGMLSQVPKKSNIKEKESAIGLESSTEQLSPPKRFTGPKDFKNVESNKETEVETPPVLEQRVTRSLSTSSKTGKGSKKRSKSPSVRKKSG